jgi:hypothetical protein
MEYDILLHVESTARYLPYFWWILGGRVRIRELIIVLAIFSLIAPLAIGGDFQQRSLSLNMLCNGFDYSHSGNGNERYRPAFKLVLNQAPDDNPKNFPLPHNNDAVRSDAHHKAVYLVCAGRYSVRADAERHIETLRLFGYSSKLNFSSRNTYRVVLGKSDKSTKAVKIKSSFGKKGVSCFIEEE